MTMYIKQANWMIQQGNSWNVKTQLITHKIETLNSLHSELVHI
jgi:hypothetical protein